MLNPKPSSSCCFSLNRAWGIFAVVLLVANIGAFLYATERSRQEVVQARLQGALAQAQVLEAHLHYSLTAVQAELVTLKDELKSEKLSQNVVTRVFQRALHDNSSLEALLL
ncbi:MAG: hypothetical protein ACRDD3_02065, partial [Azovibrio sp.]